MYKLRRIEATNVIGFRSGLGRKKFELDLGNQMEHSIITVIGDNGSGKSCLLSLIHPTVWPTDGRRKFVVPGKEGILNREYVSDDGAVIRTKCIYKPKKGGDGHTASCYFELTKPGKKPKELNPSGNVTSYESLLYDYFGITRDFVSFATYSAEVASIVKMTDQERKDSVSTMTPNVRKFERAYDVLNDKYKSLNTLAKDVAKRIAAYRTEEELEHDVKMVDDELKRATAERERSIRRVAEMEGRLRELGGGHDFDGMLEEYNRMADEVVRSDMEMRRLRTKLLAMCARAGLDVDDDDETALFDEIQRIPVRILRYERELAESRGKLAGYKEYLSRARNDLSRIENEMADARAALYGIQTQDVESLTATLEGYRRQLSEMRYSKDVSRYDNLSYDEGVDLSRAVASLGRMVESMYDSYGELMSSDAEEPHDIETMRMELESMEAKRDQLRRDIIEREQYRRLKDILDRRPAECVIDDCPFIANALQWNTISREIDILRDRLTEADIAIVGMTRALKDAELVTAFHRDWNNLVNYVNSMFPRLTRYLGIENADVVLSSIRAGTWETCLDLVTLKGVIAVLSEKELYHQIVNQRIPETERAIEISRAYGANRDMLIERLERLERSRAETVEIVEHYAIQIGLSEKAIEMSSTRLELWDEISDNLGRFANVVKERLDMLTSLNASDAKIKSMRKLRDKMDEERRIAEEYGATLSRLYPRSEKLKMDLDAVRRLKADRRKIEDEFTVTSVMRQLVAPGKGIRKELIGIYMDEIKDVANRLLASTFGGRLMLRDFVITDKEFSIPYVYADSEGSDISYASASQQSTIATAISLAILSKVISAYGVLTFDEVDAPLNQRNKSEFIHVLSKQMEVVGVSQAWIVTQSPALYEPYDVLFVKFPGGDIDSSGNDVIEV